MYKRIEDEKKQRLETLQRQLLWLENSDWSAPIMRQWHRYQAMTIPQRVALRKQWDKYFEDCRSTIAFKRFETISDIFKHKIPSDQKSELRQLSRDSKDQIENQSWELSKPSLEDPAFLEANGYVNKYLEINNEIKQIKNEIFIDGKTDKEVAEEIGSMFK